MSTYTTMRDDLQAALAKLEAFNSKNLPEKTLALMRAFFSGKLSERTREKQRQERSELLRAIGVLKDHLELIEKLQKGTPQQQKLAATALSTIERFNALVDKAAVKRSSLTARIRDFLQDHSGEILPKHLPKIPYKAILLTSAAGSSTHKVEHFGLQRVSLPSLAHQPLPFLSRQAVELFYMKTISLIEIHGLLTHLEARQAVQKGVVMCQLDPNPTTCTAHCHVADFLVKIRFRKDGSKETYTCIDAYEITKCNGNGDRAQ
jgi:hypothetical protein